MPIKTILLSQLEADPRGTLDRCADSGKTLAVVLPGDRRVAIQPIATVDDDSLISDLLESSTEFTALLARSKESPRAPFTRAAEG